MVSIIILNWNGKHHLDECLSSLLNQTFREFEIIIVDNGSNDGSQEYIRKNYPQVNLICLDKNYGFCKGNNIGIRAAKGEYIALLNNDTKADTKWLENLYSCIISDQTVGFCASKMLYYCDNNIIDSAGDGFAVCGAGFKRGHGYEANKYIKNDYTFGACAGAAIYKREMLDKIGLLDEDFFAIYEDVDLSYRAQLAGYKCKYVADAIVYHKVNSSLGKFSDFYIYYGHRNVEFVYLKNMSLMLLLRTIIPHFIYNILAFGYFLKKGKGLIFLKAKLAVFKEIKNIVRKRNIVKKLKVVDNSYLWGNFEKRWLANRTKGK